MSHTFQLSDEQYARLAAYAARQKQTPERLFQDGVREVTYDVQESPLCSSPKEEYEPGSLLFQVAGMFAIGEPGWADKHDEYLAEACTDEHAEK